MKELDAYLKACEPFDEVTLKVLPNGKKLIENRNKKMRTPVEFFYYKNYSAVVRDRLKNCISLASNSDEAQRAMQNWWTMMQEWFEVGDKDFRDIQSLYNTTVFREALNRAAPGFAEYFQEVSEIFATKSSPRK